MSGDGAMAAAGRQTDLYQGVVDAGIVQTRKQAKVAMLGAIYGATTGASAVLMPQLTRAFPRAVGMVEAAARAGERGEIVSTWLGRSSPPPGEAWRAAIAAASSEEAGPEDARAARGRRRDWGRFTRNFIVQGTAAEWALCWMAALRRRLLAIEGRPHLVLFLHDEVMVHSPSSSSPPAATWPPSGPSSSCSQDHRGPRLAQPRAAARRARARPRELGDDRAAPHGRAGPHPRRRRPGRRRHAG